MNPLVSIITPSFNQGEFIEKTIESILNQTYNNIEYIIVDGLSTDKTMSVIDKYKPKITKVIHEKDNGQSDAINKGFKMASGTLIGWINSDDILYPHAVEAIVELYTKHNDGAIFYGNNLDIIDDNGNKIKTIHKPIPNRDFLLKRNYDVIQQGSFYNTQFVKEVNLIDPTLHYCMDLDLWLRLLKFGPIYAVEGNPIAAFRRWNETKTSTGGINFLNDIKNTLIKNGAPPFSKTLNKVRYQTLKLLAKQLITS
ncbi:glycosyltransferase family 2 protein [Tellurirhabdus rosea]|uniref:glycosyltransferase family 2 protein n=1 Tax=Tellurirhabdus rosea TaxID=2674997 RepID=UPI002251F792|nr:glycosyltransferase family 2 protein [Tellurirhabdus rosea]